jgi:dolichol-phosphate mannosyltransferase
VDLLILPAFNEAPNVPPLIEAIIAVQQQSDRDLTVLVIDDGSTDNTAEVVQSLQVRFSSIQLLQHHENRGLGAGIRSGLAYAHEHGFTTAIVMDADLSHNPQDLPAFWAALDNGADLVVGSRYIGGGGMKDVPWWRRTISNVGNRVGRHILGVSIRDMTSGFRGFRVATAGSLSLEEDGYGIQLEAVVKAAAAHLCIVEVPIILKLRRFGSSKMLYNAVFWRNYLFLFWRALHWARMK